MQLKNTQSAYKKTTEQLIGRFKYATGRKSFSEADLADLATWMIDHLRYQVGPNSWRTYRYQVCQCIDDPSFFNAVNMPPARKKSEISSDEKGSYRTRHLKDKVFNTLSDYLKKSKSKYAAPLHRTLQLGRCAGLRPSEWGTAQVKSYQGSPYLLVRTVKKGLSEQETLNETRSIPLDHLTGFELEMLHEHLEYISKNTPYSRIHDGIAQFLRQVTRALFYGSNQRPTLYSARHQFAANLKASGIHPDIIAAVMGHVDTEMQTRYYGRTTSGYQIVFNESLAKELNGLN